MSDDNVCIIIVTQPKKRLSDTIKKNIHLFPKIRVLPLLNQEFDIDSFNKCNLNEETLECLTLKASAFRKQIDDNYPYMVVLQDNLLLKEGFLHLIDNIISQVDLEDTYSLVRLGALGEGYVSSLTGANKVINHLLHRGVTGNFDTHLGLLCPNLKRQLCVQHQCWNPDNTSAK
tara:strand:- start:586 stop:1107 length:522 start_codon:yes stop_codon:yes gene_type:complete